jgi:hypothetical protein
MAIADADPRGMHHPSEGTCFSVFDAIQSIRAIKTPDTTKVR